MEDREHLPGRIGIFRAGKQDMLQIPPWHRTIYLLMNWIMNGFSSRANYIQCVTSEAALSVGMCSPLVCINTGKVEPHDYTSQMIDKVKAIA